jgi:signal transduction histidine kinase
MVERQLPAALLDSLPGLAYRGRPDSPRRFTFASEGCLQITGYTAAEMTQDQGVAYGDLIHPEDQAAVQGEIETALREKRPYHCLYRLLAAGNQERWVWESGQGVFSEDGLLTALEGFIAPAGDPEPPVKRLQGQIADQSRKLSALHGILEALGTPAELPTVLKKSLKAGLVAVQGDAGFIHLRDKTGKKMRLIAREGIPDPMAERIATVSTDDGLVAWVTRNKESLLIPHIGHDPRTVYLVPSGDLNTYVGVPISRGKRVWGTLSVLGKDPRQFGAEDVALLGSVGEEIGVVVENARLRRQTDRLLLFQERNRLARELHDSVTQSLYSVTLFAEAGRRTALADAYEEAADYFTQIGETGGQALKEMRLLIYRLRPSILAKEGLARALQHRLNSVEGRAGVKSRLVVEGKTKLSSSLEDTLYHIAQEALNNALKHALASEVTVYLDTTGDKQAVIKIEDNGRGFDPDTAAEGDGMGLVSMRERAESFNGSLTIHSTPGQGSVVEARLSTTSGKTRWKESFGPEDLP